MYAVVTLQGAFSVWVAGARRNEPDSDIDIIVEFDPDARVGIIAFESLAEELSSLTARTVDLVTKRGLKPWVRTEVLKDIRIMYAA